MKELFKKRIVRDLAQLAAGFIIILLLNFLSGIRFKRFDLTSEKRYSLSDSTKKILRGMDDVMLVKVYLEGKDDELNVGFKRLRNSTKEILQEFRYYAKGNLEYIFIDPFADPDPKV